MAWLGKVSLGGFPDLAGAVTKFSESVKNIEKNFDSALGLEEKSEQGEDRRALFDPVMAFMGQKARESSVEPSEKAESLQPPSPVEGFSGVSTEGTSLSASEQTVPVDKEGEKTVSRDGDAAESTSNVLRELDEAESDQQQVSVESKTVPSVIGNQEISESVESFRHKDAAEQGSIEESQSDESKSISSNVVEQVENGVLPLPDESHHTSELPVGQDEQKTDAEQYVESASPVLVDALKVKQVTEPEGSDSSPVGIVEAENATELLTDSSPSNISLGQAPNTTSESAFHDSGSPIKSVDSDGQANDFENDNREHHLRSESNVSDFVDPGIEMQKVKTEMKMMEAALQGAARQSQAKADEIAKLMNENEQLKSTIDGLKRKSVEAESDALREEYLQRVATLERKVYALTKERDTLRREQSRKSDAAALLKEKDEIINQVMAEGEELSKKQAAQESTIRKLRAQIRELEEEKQRLNSKLQVEETKVESIKRDKAATEKLLQETIEKSQAEVAAQKEFYTNALNAAKEAESLAEARANNEARTELESRLREAGEREATLVQALEELRQTLSRTEQQAVFREDMLRRDIDDLQKRYQASELRCEELITQVPESTRPLLRQIEAMQETTARRADAWAGVERALNSRLQEAEAKAAASEEKERSMNERLSQTLSRMAVLEAQVSCLRAEQTQLSRSLEKERQRASENRQEYLAAMEAAATHEGRAKQLEDEIKELRSKHKQELQQEIMHRELVEKVMSVVTPLSRIWTRFKHLDPGIS